jgi:hypothetical protein
LIILIILGEAYKLWSSHTEASVLKYSLIVHNRCVAFATLRC